MSIPGIPAERAELRIELPLPPKELSPNARVHWRVKAKAAKEYRARAWAEAVKARVEAGMAGPPLWIRATAQVTFFFATNRRRDGDNLLASTKSAFDGIADVGVILNDSGLTHLPPVLKVDKARPRVEIVIRPLSEEGARDDG